MIVFSSLKSRHFFQRAGLYFAPVSRNANRGPLRARHGMSPISQGFDLAANGAHLFVRGVRLHDN